MSFGLQRNARELLAQRYGLNHSDLYRLEPPVVELLTKMASRQHKAENK